MRLRTPPVKRPRQPSVCRPSCSPRPRPRPPPRPKTSPPPRRFAPRLRSWPSSSPNASVRRRLRATPSRAYGAPAGSHPLTTQTHPSRIRLKLNTQNSNLTPPPFEWNRTGAGPLTPFSSHRIVGMAARPIPPRSGRRNDVIGPPAARSRRLRFAQAPRGAAALVVSRRSAPHLRRSWLAALSGVCCGPRCVAIWPSRARGRVTPPRATRDEARSAPTPPTEVPGFKIIPDVVWNYCAGARSRGQGLFADQLFLSRRRFRIPNSEFSQWPAAACLSLPRIRRALRSPHSVRAGSRCRRRRGSAVRRRSPTGWARCRAS